MPDGKGRWTGAEPAHVARAVYNEDERHGPVDVIYHDKTNTRNSRKNFSLAVYHPRQSTDTASIDGASKGKTAYSPVVGSPRVFGEKYGFDWGDHEGFTAADGYYTSSSYAGSSASMSFQARQPELGSLKAPSSTTTPESVPDDWLEECI